ncbi:MAG TPA: sigma-54 dependent transcriptional regulator [Kofleriaceae bacterium]|nr:sigma-54 dependent transcriptional regulator [Kofleriaceae bacterium]
MRRILATSGSWGVTEIPWPDVPPPDALNAIQLYILGTSADGPSEDLIGFLRARGPSTPLVVIGRNPARMAVPSLWLPTAPPPALLVAIVNQFLGGEGEGDGSGSKAPWRRKGDMILGSSQHVRDLLHSLDHLAPAQTPVCITGESGVGKELVARALHYSSPRAPQPFIAINCGAVPETLFESELFGYQKGAFTGAVATHIGAFEAADKGTLFLDEIGEMPMAMQVKLLRVLQTYAVQRVGATEAKQVNFRLVTATNRDLAAEVKVGRFREDLFYRIHVYPLHIAPLRERPEDILPIVTHHLSMIAEREKRPHIRVSNGALEKLLAYAWPGNVRELINTLERAALLAGADQIEAEHVMLPTGTANEAAASLLPYREAKAKFEHEYYSQLMRTADGNVSLAAKLGQKTRKEIYDALKRLGLDAMAFRSDGD